MNIFSRVHQALVPPKQPLSMALLQIDSIWAVESKFGERAMHELKRIDRASHTAEFEATGTNGSDQDSTPYTVEDGIAWFSIAGPMTKKPQSWGGGTSTINLRRSLRLAMADDTVKGAFLTVDSPGGSVAGTADLADDIQAFAAKKPILAYVEDMACSAAYWASSQASKLYANRTSALANIGTMCVIEDTSKMYEADGVTCHLIATGPFKGMFAGGVPVSQAWLDEVQREVTELNEHFINAVSTGRKLPLSKARSLANGSVFIGQKAVDAGLADGICSIDDAYATLLAMVDSPGNGIPPDDDDDDDNLPGSKDSRRSHSDPTVKEVEAAAPASDLVAANLPSVKPAVALVSDSTKEKAPMVNMIDRIMSAVKAGNGGTTDDFSDEQLKAALLLEETEAKSAANVSARQANERDLLAVLSSAGITSQAHIRERLEMAKIGDRYAEETREDAKTQAIRANGAEIGQALATSCETLPIGSVAAMREAWKAEADKKFGISADGSAPARVSAPTAIKVAVPAEGDAEEKKSSFEQLNPDMQKTLSAMHKDPAKRESAAAAFLAGKGDK